MSQLRALAGQTAIYGLSSIVGRLLNYLLVPLYTRVFLPEQYGIVSEFYAYISFLMVVYTLGLETAYFHFSNNKLKQENVFGHAQFTLTCTTAFFTLLLLLFASPIAAGIGHPEHPEYVRWFAWILAFDTLSTLPFARLRQQNKALRFALVKLGGIFINIGLTLLLLLVLPSTSLLPGDSTAAVGYVFIANLAASGCTLLLLLPELRQMRTGFKWSLIRELVTYGFPLLIAGLAGMINETLDRAILKYLIPDQRLALEQLGVYSACYKLSILMTLFVQTFRYAAEPFYFSQQHKENSRELFARVMEYFVLIGCCIFLVVMFYMDIIKFFIGENFHSGLGVVPILLMANLCLGIYLNLSIWYKLSGKTGYGAWLSVLGALITVVFNLWLIPSMGYTGAAWATLFCYGSMLVFSYLKGQQVWSVPYNTTRLLMMLGLTVVVWLVWEQLRIFFPLDALRWSGISLLLLFAYFGTWWKLLGGQTDFLRFPEK